MASFSFYWPKHLTDFTKHNHIFARKDLGKPFGHLIVLLIDYECSLLSHHICIVSITKIVCIRLKLLGANPEESWVRSTLLSLFFIFVSQAQPFKDFNTSRDFILQIVRFDSLQSRVTGQPLVNIRPAAVSVPNRLSNHPWVSLLYRCTQRAPSLSYFSITDWALAGSRRSFTLNWAQGLCQLTHSTP